MKNRLATTLLVTALAACSSTDDHAHENAGADASKDTGGTSADAGAIDGAAADASSAADAATCTPECTATQVCCVDAHGHFPTCQPGPTCP